jgi:hypothetical protein
MNYEVNSKQMGLIYENLNNFKKILFVVKRFFLWNNE